MSALWVWLLPAIACSKSGPVGLTDGIIEFIPFGSIFECLLIAVGLNRAEDVDIHNEPVLYNVVQGDRGCILYCQACTSFSVISESLHLIWRIPNATGLAYADSC